MVRHNYDKSLIHSFHLTDSVNEVESKVQKDSLLVHINDLFLLEVKLKMWGIDHRNTKLHLSKEYDYGTTHNQHDIQVLRGEYFLERGPSDLKV